MSPWSVRPYSIGALRELLEEHSAGSFSGSVHEAYLEEYLPKIGVSSMVVERDYIDHDFLEDFAAYYVRCFKPYPKTCARIHFFGGKPVKEKTLERMLEGSRRARKLLVDGYRGFLVARPVPQRPIGRACLKAYAGDEERQYTNLRRYEANLFGLPLEVRSLAFQQQDRTVAACATSALWSAFQATGKIFGHRIPSPAEITIAAAKRIPLDSRTLPATQGLTPEQMADAIRACDLEPLLVGAEHPHLLRAAVRAYAGACIPLVMVGEIQERDKPDQPVAMHAVTVTGYRIARDLPMMGFLSDRMTKLYVHDDAVGPFARMAFEEAPGSTMLTTSLAPSRHHIGTRRFCPRVALVPLYHKIRVPFSRVLEDVASLQHYLAQIRGSGAVETELFPSFEWDIQLTTVNDYKSAIVAKARDATSRKVLETPLPRFLWIARATHADDTGFDLIFDATGIESDNLCILRVDRGSPVPALLRDAGFTADQFEITRGAADALLAGP